jgi:glycosyltransferase involved in cell wall biosynthesis
MKDVTIVVTHFARPDSLEIFLKSVRKFYPKIQIIISDNGRLSEDMLILANKYLARWLKLPFNCGANTARSAGLGEVKTDYAVLCEDDMEFSKETDLEAFRNVLERDGSVGLVGGAVRRKGRLGIVGARLEIDREKSVFYRDKGKHPDFNIANGTPYFYCDYVRMFFMKRVGMWIPWEEELYPSSGSHISIMIKLKEAGLYKLAFTFDCEVLHHKARPSIEYNQARDHRQEFKKIFYKTMGLRYGVYNHERVEDFKTNTKMTYENFLKNVLKEGV